MLSLPGPVFFKLAYRIGSYQGVMRDIVTAAAHEQAQRDNPQPQYGGGSYGGGQRTVVGGSRQELQMAPEFAGVFSFATAG